eukprot:GHRR01032692.1.p1 GENE.GHRR01032692.1~~GHRR01032692.1.p1  ORF type:complete len:111 (-),score=11.64 GHRR01032692.1:247-579(-)
MLHCMLGRLLHPVIPIAGLVGCLLLCLLVSGLEAFTLYVLAKYAERYDARSYGTLVRRALGRRTAAGFAGVLLVYLWGSCIAYLVRQMAEIILASAWSAVGCQPPCAAHS